MATNPERYPSSGRVEPPGCMLPENVRHDAVRRGSVIGRGPSSKIMVMTDLLSPAARRTSSGAGGRLAGRPIMLTAVVGGLVSAGLMLFVTAAVALAGWFAADAGRYGDTRDALRVGADAWLLAHGTGLHLGTTTISLLPLGLTAACAYVARRVGLWAAETSSVGSRPAELPTVLAAAGVQATVYAVVALGVAVLAGVPSAESGLLRALAGGFALSLLAGGGGLLTGSGQARPLAARLPTGLRSVLVGAVATVLLLFFAGSVLVGAALVTHFGTAATVLSRLHTDGPGGLMYTVVGVLFVPNAVVLGGAYLLGPGFAVGTGTLVSPTAVILGPLPAFPLLAALPGDGPTPGWTTALLAVPVVVAAVAVLLGRRLHPVDRVDVAAMRGLGAGALAALLFTVLTWLAGGAAGPGRMADVGADSLNTLLAAAVSFGGGGLVGGVVGALWARLRSRRQSSRGGATGA